MQMKVEGCEASLRMSVAVQAQGWRWSLRRGETLVAGGEAGSLDAALRSGAFAAAALNALARVGRRRF